MSMINIVVLQRAGAKIGNCIPDFDRFAFVRDNELVEEAVLCTSSAKLNRR